MRRKNISDQEVTVLIKKGRVEVLANLFERNIVNCLNLFDRHGLDEKTCHRTLALSCSFIWEYFSHSTWKPSSHKVDFMIDFLNRRQLAQTHGVETKLPYQYPELDILLDTYKLEPEKIDIILTNNLNVLNDSLKDLLAACFFEKTNIDKLAIDLNQTDEYIEEQRVKGFSKWVQLLRQNANYRISLDEFLADLPIFIGYYCGELSKTKMLDFEMKLAESDTFKKQHDQFLELVYIIRWNRRKKITDFIQSSATTKLTGNIWGNRWSMVSALFIILIGMLIWYIDNFVEPTPLPNSVQETQDTVLQKPIND